MPVFKAIKNYIHKYVHRETTLRFQVFSIVISFTIVMILFIKALGIFTTTDQRPALRNITPMKQAEVGASAATIKTGLFVRSFQDFDIKNNEFVADLVLWFEFDPTAISLETVEKFSFEKGKVLYRSPPNTKLINGNLLAMYEIRIAFSTNLDYHFFPFSDHRIFIVLTNKFIAPSEMFYKATGNGFSVSDDIYAAGWQYVGKGVEYGFISSQLEAHDIQKIVTYPRVIFSLDFAKSGVRQIFLILIPILLIFFLGLFSLSLDPVIHARAIIALSVGSITSLLGYRFVIEKLSPTVGYFMVSDHIFTYILAMTFFIFLIGTYTIRSRKVSETLKIIRIITIVLFHTGLIGVVYYLLFVWQP